MNRVVRFLFGFLFFPILVISIFGIFSLSVAHPVYAISGVIFIASLAFGLVVASEADGGW